VPVTGVVNTVVNLWISQKTDITLQAAWGLSSEYSIINFNHYENIRFNIALIYV
jgi:hypothetical protein